MLDLTKSLTDEETVKALRVVHGDMAVQDAMRAILLAESYPTGDVKFLDNQGSAWLSSSCQIS